MKSRLYSILASLALLVALTTTAAAQSPVGTWNLNVNAGGSDYPGVLTLVQQGDSLTGTYGAEGGTGATIQKVRFVSDSLSFEFDTPDYGKMIAKGTIKDNAFNGTLSMTFGDFPMTGTRKAEAKPALSTRSMIGQLLENEQAKAVLEKHVPGLTTNPQLQQAINMSLQDVAPYAPDTFTEQVLKAIDEDLSKIQ